MVCSPLLSNKKIYVCISTLASCTSELRQVAHHSSVVGSDYVQYGVSLVSLPFPCPLLALVTELEITVLPLEWAFELHSGPAFSSLLCGLPVLFPASHFKAQGFLLLNTMSNSLLDLSPAETSGQGATSVLTLSHLCGQSNYVVPKTQEPIDLTN